MDNQPTPPTAATNDLLRLLLEPDFPTATEPDLPIAMVVVLLLLIGASVLVIGPLVAMLALIGGVL